MKIIKRILLIILLLATLAAGAWFIFQHMNAPALELKDVPEYDGQAAVDINKGRPAFAEDEIKDSFFEDYSRLDRLGRSGTATACLDSEHMPKGERGSIGMVKPSGWQIEAMSVEDRGVGLSINAFCYNVQPGVEINYKTGDSKLKEK